MPAQGTIRIRCKVCRKLGQKDSYAIQMAKEIRCKHPEVVYQALFPGPDGKQIPKTCATLGAAKVWIAKIATELNEGTYARIEPKKFKEIALQYLENQRGNIRIGSYGCDEDFVNRLIAEFGEYPISKITIEMLNDFMKPHKLKKFSTPQKFQRHLKAIFLLAEQLGAINKNPTRFMKNVKNISPRKTYNGLNLSFIPQLIQDTKDPFVSFYYQMAFFTGMRPSEQCGLKLSSINMEKKEFKVEQTCYWFKDKDERGDHAKPFIFYPCKTSASYRVLPIGKQLFEALQIFLIHRRENPYNLLFARRNGDPLRHSIDIIKKHYKPQIKRLSEVYNCPVLDFYDLTRHTYASMLFEMKISHKKIQYLMGHEDYQTTANVYARLFGKDISEDNDYQVIADQMEAFVSK